MLDIHDGELLPTLEHRRTLTRLIREWKADLVLSHRPNDYHPDHRNVGVLVQDAAYMVTVPFFCPDTPFLQKNPVFLYFEDRFTKPNRFSADVVVAIDDVIDKKLAVVEALESQFYEGGCNGGPDLVPSPGNAAAVAARKKEVRKLSTSGSPTRPGASTCNWRSGTAPRRRGRSSTPRRSRFASTAGCRRRRDPQTLSLLPLPRLKKARNHHEST